MTLEGSICDNVAKKLMVALMIVAIYMYFAGENICTQFPRAGRVPVTGNRIFYGCVILVAMTQYHHNGCIDVIITLVDAFNSRNIDDID